MATNKSLIEETFLNKEGKEVAIKSIISEEDCWQLKKEQKWVLSHRAIQKIAREAGISKNYLVAESDKIIPTYKNELEHVVRVTIRCLAPEQPGIIGSCVHDSEDTLTVTGEANKVNTPTRGRGYLRRMAEKRAFDIAVLEHLGLYSSVYSEDESQDFDSEQTRYGRPSESISNVEIEQLRDEINLLVNAKTKGELSKAVIAINKLKKTKNYNATQKSFLKEAHARQIQRLEKTFE